MRAVLYLRMSSDKQDTSIPSQRKALSLLAAEKKWKIVGEYSDSGISGDATEKRLGFQQMMSDCHKKRFDVILCWDQDRFGRFDPLEAGFWVKPMRDAGIVLHTIAQGPIDWTQFAGRLTYMVGQEAKHSYLRDMSRNCLRGALDAARAGKWASGPPPLGYVCRDGKLYVDEAAAGLVRRIFDDYLAGRSLRDIANALNVSGIKSRRGGNWQQSTIRTIITNPVYTGDFYWNRLTIGKYNSIRDGKVQESNGRGLRKNARGEWVVIPNTHVGIITKAEFKQVKKRLDGNRGKTAPTKSSGKYLLSGLVYCTHCGSRMTGKVATNQLGTQYRHYLCSGNRMRGAAFCEPYSISQADLLKRVLDKLMDRLSDDGLKRMVEEAEKKAKEPTPVANPEPIRRRIAAVDQRLSLAVERLMEVPKDMVQSVSENIRKLREERVGLQDALDEIEYAAPAESAVEVANRAAENCRRLRDLLDPAKPVEFRKAVAQLIQRIDLQFRRKQSGKHYRNILLGMTITYTPLG